MQDATVETLLKGQD